MYTRLTFVLPVATAIGLVSLFDSRGVLANGEPGLHGLQLGQLARGLDIWTDLPTGPTVDSMSNQLTWIAGHDNRLTHIILSLPLSAEMEIEEQRDALYGEMVARHGPATKVTDSLHGPYKAIWEDPDGRFEYSLRQVAGASFSQSFVIMLESRDPARLCGSADGFREWFADWQAAIHSNDKEDILGRFQVPFYSVDFYPEVAPFGVNSREELDELWGSELFNDFLTAVRQVDLELIDEDGGPITCNVLPEEGNIQGYSVSLGETTLHLPLIVDRVEASWMARGIAYQP